MSIRKKPEYLDLPKPNEGCLVIMLSDKESVQIGEARVHLNYIHKTGINGGIREVNIAIVAPKSVPIRRFKRSK